MVKSALVRGLYGRSAANLGESSVANEDWRGNSRSCMLLANFISHGLFCTAHNHGPTWMHADARPSVETAICSRAHSTHSLSERAPFPHGSSRSAAHPDTRIIHVHNFMSDEECATREPAAGLFFWNTSAHADCCEMNRLLPQLHRIRSLSLTVSPSRSVLIERRASRRSRIHRHRAQM